MENKNTYNKEYYIKNKQKMLESYKKYYEKNKIKIQEKRKQHLYEKIRKQILDEIVNQ